MKFCVIGLGRFGYEVATTLAENGMEVLAVDSDETIIASIRDEVTQAVCMHIIDESSLRSIGVEEMDTTVVAVGEHFAESILITALLKKKLQAVNVITRATNEIHQEILHLVGADRVVLPEQEIGRKLANNLSSPLLDAIQLSEELYIGQIPAPEKIIDAKLGTLDLQKLYRITCIGIKQGNGVVPADQNYVLSAGDKLIVSGNKHDINRFARS